MHWLNESTNKKQKMGYFFHNIPCVLISMVNIFFPAIPSPNCPSPSTSPVGVDLQLQQICSKTYNPPECLNLFKSDPRSFNADMKGLAGVAVDLALNKANAVHTEYNQLYSDTSNSNLRDKYVGCSKNYNDAIRDLQSVKRDLDTNRYNLITVEINDALEEVTRCINVFKRDPVDHHMDDQNEEFKLLCYMVKITSNSVMQK